jgi:hypothetical protein
MEFGFEDTIPNADEVFTAQQLFEILKTFEDSYFNELSHWRISSENFFSGLTITLFFSKDMQRQSTI